jgi:hypothetical protein
MVVYECMDRRRPNMNTHWNEDCWISRRIHYVVCTEEVYFCSDSY